LRHHLLASHQRCVRASFWDAAADGSQAQQAAMQIEFEYTSMSEVDAAIRDIATVIEGIVGFEPQKSETKTAGCGFNLTLSRESRVTSVRMLIAVHESCFDKVVCALFEDTPTPATVWAPFVAQDSPVGTLEMRIWLAPVILNVTSSQFDSRVLKICLDSSVEGRSYYRPAAAAAAAITTTKPIAAWRVAKAVRDAGGSGM
jgi:hypothetical protein